MAKKGKILRNLFLLGAAAAGAYYYIKNKNAKVPDDMGEEYPDEDFSEDLDSAADQEAKRPYVSLDYKTIEGKAQQFAAKVEDVASKASNQFEDLVSKAAGRVEEFFDDKKGAIKGVAEDVADKAEEAAEKVEEKAEELAENIEKKADEFTE